MCFETPLDQDYNMPDPRKFERGKSLDRTPSAGEEKENASQQEDESFMLVSKNREGRVGANMKSSTIMSSLR
jgi:hypothetical protein